MAFSFGVWEKLPQSTPLRDIRAVGGWRRHLFRPDEANDHESASTRLPARPPAVLSAQICPVLSRFYLAGGTLGREMRHPMYRSPYLSRHIAAQDRIGVFQTPWSEPGRVKGRRDESRGPFHAGRVAQMYCYSNCPAGFRRPDLSLGAPRRRPRAHRRPTGPCRRACLGWRRHYRATSTCRVSMVRGMPLSARTSIQSSMASRMFASASSLVPPWLTQPGMDGHSAIQTPSSSLSIVTVIFITQPPSTDLGHWTGEA